MAGLYQLRLGLEDFPSQIEYRGCQQVVQMGAACVKDPREWQGLLWTSRTHSSRRSLQLLGQSVLPHWE